MHYELTSESVDRGGSALWRVRALTDLPLLGVTEGQLGGFVAHERNLIDRAWVADQAIVTGEAKLAGDSLAAGSALVSGRARMSGRGRVIDSASIGDDAFISGNGTVSGFATVYGSARVYDDGHVTGTAMVYGAALIQGTVDGEAEVSGQAIVPPGAHVGASGSLHRPQHVLLVDNDEESLTVYRSYDGNRIIGPGWVGTLEQLEAMAEAGDELSSSRIARIAEAIAEAARL